MEEAAMTLKRNRKWVSHPNVERATKAVNLCSETLATMESWIDEANQQTLMSLKAMAEKLDVFKFIIRLLNIHIGEDSDVTLPDKTTIESTEVDSLIERYFQRYDLDRTGNIPNPNPNPNPNWRYDLDGTGNIDPVMDLDMLSLNLIQKLKLKASPAEIEKKGKKVKELASLSLDDFKVYFKKQFLAKGGSGKARLFPCFHACYNVLTKLCTGNARNQNFLTSHMSIFRGHLHIFSNNYSIFSNNYSIFGGHLQYVELRSALTLAEIYRDNKVLLDRCTHSDFNELFERLEDLPCIEWVRLLVSMVWCNRTRHAVNATIVGRLFVQHSGVLVYMKPGSQEEDARLNCAAIANGTANIAAVAYHLELVELLCCCCEGKAADNEVRAQTIMDMPHMMNVLLECIYELHRGSSLDAATIALLLRIKATYVKFLYEVFIDSGAPNVIRSLYVDKCGFWSLPDPNPVDPNAIGVGQKDGVIYTISLMSDIKFSVQRLCTLAREIGEEMVGSSDNQDKVDEYEIRKYFVFEVVIPLLRSYYDEHHQDDFDEGAKMTQELANVILALKLQKLIQQEPRKMLLLDKVLEQIAKFAEVSQEDIKSVAFDERRQEPVARSILNRMWHPYVIWLAKQLLVPDPRQPYGIGTKFLAELLSPDGEYILDEIKMDQGKQRLYECNDQMEDLDDEIREKLEKHEKQIPDLNFEEKRYLGLQSFRQPIWRIFDIIRRSPKCLSDDLQCELICISRALIYLDDPNSTASANFEMLDNIQEAVAKGVDAREILRDKSASIQWKRMINDLPPEKAAPEAETLTWVQSKYAQLSCEKMVADLVNHQNKEISLQP